MDIRDIGGLSSTDRVPREEKFSLSDLASLANLTSGVAVLVSLAFLSAQVRQSHRNQRSMLIQQRTAAGVEAMFHVTDPNLAAMMVKARHAPEELTEIELSQYLSMSRALWIWYEDAYHQNKASLLDGDAFSGILLI